MLERIEEILEGAKRYERYVAALCPFHDDHHPSLLVWEDYYKCFSCGASGKTSSLFSRLSETPRKHIYTSFRSFNPWRRWLSDLGSLERIINIAFRSCPTQYLRERGIKDEIQKELMIGYLSGWYIFPFFDDCDKLVGAIARRDESNGSQAKYLSPPNQKNSHLIYVPSHEILRRSKVIFVTMGIIDAISLFQIGLASASILGLFTDARNFDRIRKPIIIIPDSREEKFGLQLSSKLGWRGRAKILNYPDGTKDINDVLMKFGETTVMKLLKE